MKKIMQLAVMITISLLLQGNTLTPRSANKSFTQSSGNKTSSVLLNYTWFYDPWLTDPVGVTQSVNDELTRLRSSYPFAFSSTGGLGMVPFEYGRLGYTTVVIYSNWPLY